MTNVTIHIFYYYHYNYYLIYNKQNIYIHLHIYVNKFSINHISVFNNYVIIILKISSYDILNVFCLLLNLL